MNSVNLKPPVIRIEDEQVVDEEYADDEDESFTVADLIELLSKVDPTYTVDIVDVNYGTPLGCGDSLVFNVDHKRRVFLLPAVAQDHLD